MTFESNVILDKPFILFYALAFSTRLYTVSLSTGSKPARSIISIISCVVILTSPPDSTAVAVGELADVGDGAVEVVGAEVEVE